MRISPFQRGYIRKRAGALMVDECRIYTAGTPTLDRTSGKSTRTSGVVKYEGPCRLWEVRATNYSIIGEQEIVLTTTYLSLPFDAPLPESSDIVSITKSVDPDLVGRTVAILSMTRGGGLRASRVFLVQVQESAKASW